MMVVVEGRRPLSWSCKQINDLTRTCPQKPYPTTATSITTIIITWKTPVPLWNLGNNKKIQVTRNKRSLEKTAATEATPVATTEITTIKTATETTTQTTTAETVETSQPLSPPPKKQKKGKKKITEGEQLEQMETSTNLKRRETHPKNFVPNLTPNNKQQVKSQ